MSNRKPDHSQWGFMSIFDRFVPTVWLTASEIYIIWVLGEEGPISMYSLGKKSRTMPEISSSLGNYGWESYPGKGKRYDYRVIHSKVKTLVKKNLVEHLTDNRREPKLRLTFSGLLFYLQNLRASEKKSIESGLKHVLSKNYSEVLNSYYSEIPVFSNWKTIVEKSKPRNPYQALEDTVVTFKAIPVRFNIRPLELEFKGFLKYGSLKTLAPGYERDGKVSEFLKTREAITLRDSYIAYLAADNINSLAGKNLEEIERVTDIESEKELAYFENRNVGSNDLFKGRRLLEFFPKYAGIEFFFTGMFVENLLWNKRPDEKPARQPRTSDFEVEYLQIIPFVS